MNDQVNVYLPFAKKNDEERTVEGYASTEALDYQGEVVKYTAIEQALPDYMKFGNIREMHQPSAVGKTVTAIVDKVKKGLWIKVKVVDDNAWKKVKEGVYNGFSIGGSIVEKIGNTIEALRLVEISLVDRPANPEALFSVVKFDEVKKDAIAVDEPQMPKYTNIFTASRVLDLASELVDLYDWYSYSKKDVSNIVKALEALKALAQQVLSEEQAQKFATIVESISKMSTEERNNLPDSVFAYIDSQGNRKLPCHDEAHTKNAVARFSKTKFESDEAKKKAAKNILSAAKHFGIEVADDSSVAQEAKKFVFSESIDTFWAIDYFNQVEKSL